VTAEPETNLIDQTPAQKGKISLIAKPSHAPWIKSISIYERKETTVVEGPRYG
jgi:hypothetical protein